MAASTSKLWQMIARKESIIVVVLLTWLYCFRMVKQENPISVTILVQIDKALMLQQGLPHEWLGAYTLPFLDVFAAIPYLFHNASPFVFGIYLYNYRRDEMFRFFWNLFFFNFFATGTHLLFPTAPPWYYAKHGELDVYPYEGGHPAGLQRVDELLGSAIITHFYQANKIVFGACPSVHAGWPFIFATFLPAQLHIHPAVPWILNFYVVWMWWAAMYLQHHYLIDLLAASMYIMAIQKVFHWCFPEWMDKHLKPN